MIAKEGKLSKARARLPQAPEVRTVFIISSPSPSQPESQPAPRRIPRWAGKTF